MICINKIFMGIASRISLIFLIATWHSDELNIKWFIFFHCFMKIDIFLLFLSLFLLSLICQP